MALTPRLELRQSQSLVMTPQLQQAIKLLQLSNVELTEFVEKELELNPLLERDENRGEGPDGAEEAQEAPLESETDGDKDGLRGVDTAAADDQRALREVAQDSDYDNLWGDANPTPVAGNAPDGMRDAAFSRSGRGGGRGFDDGIANLEETLSEQVSLRDHLGGQLAIDVEDPVDRLIGLHLIDMLDEAGYVPNDLSPIVATLDCSMERVEATLEKLQHFDPPGIFARSLSECLALQLRDRNRLDPAIQALLDNLELMAKRDFPALAKIIGADAEDLTEMLDEIGSLDPKPALVFDHTPAQAITPDVLMRPHPMGGWIVELNSETLPRVLVNNQYFARVRKTISDKTEKQYLNDCMQTATWLVKSLHQRATTILKVATELVRQQELFFIKGVQYLRPLVLRDIASVIDMHESTVSRVTSNKYIATPRGIYELKYFFTQSISSSFGGEAHSAESVRHRIKALINAENADGILSDDSIVETLNAEGVEIARRTVAKYRKIMRISSSVQRRREKMARR